VSIEKQYRNVRVRDKNPIAPSLGIQPLRGFPSPPPPRTLFGTGVPGCMVRGLEIERLAIANCSWISCRMPEAKDLDVVLEDFVVNDDRSFDQFSDIRTPRMFMSGLRMSSCYKILVVSVL